MPSKMPPPIEAIRGDGVRTSSRRVGRVDGQTLRFKRPNWRVWRLVPQVELWQAVLLSLNAEPAEPLQEAATRARTEYSRLPSDYWDRLKICRANLSTKGPIRPQGTPYVGMFNARCPVDISEVAVFLHDVEFDVPVEMRPETSAVAHRASSAANSGPRAESHHPVQAPARSHRTSLLQLTEAHIVSILRATSCGTAKELFRALEDGAGKDGSPFRKGAGLHRGKLFVPSVGKSIAMKTIQNAWPILREKAGMS